MGVGKDKRGGNSVISANLPSKDFHIGGYIYLRVKKNIKK